MNAKWGLFIGMIAASAVTHQLPAAAQTYPNRPIKIVVPFPAGGGADATARVVAENLSRRLAQPVYVENKPGSVGLIGTESVVRSPADGHTLLVTTDALTSAPHLLRTSFDPLKDLAPVVQFTRAVVRFTRHRHPMRRIWRGARRPAIGSAGEPDRRPAVASVPLADAAAGGCAVVRAGARDAVRAQPINVA